MNYDYIPPVPRVHRVTIEKLKAYEDLWKENDLAPHVYDWLVQNTTNHRVKIGTLGFSEHPTFFASVDFTSKTDAMSFMEKFSSEWAERETRTQRIYASEIPFAIIGEESNRIVNPTIVDTIIGYDEHAEINVGADEGGEYLEVVFSDIAGKAWLEFSLERYLNAVA